MNGKTLMELLTDYTSHLKSRNYSNYTTKQINVVGLRWLRWLKDQRNTVFPQSLRRNQLEAWQRHISAHVTTKGHPLKPRSLNKHIEVVRGFLVYLGKQGFVSKQLADSVEKVKEPQLLSNSVLNHAQARKLLESVSTASPEGFRNRTMLELFYTSGIRAAELIGLDVDEIDFGSASTIVLGKGRKERVVPIGRTALQFLENYIKAVRPFQLRDRQEKAMILGSYSSLMDYLRFL